MHDSSVKVNLVTNQDCVDVNFGILQAAKASHVHQGEEASGHRPLHAEAKLGAHGVEKDKAADKSPCRYPWKLPKGDTLQVPLEAIQGSYPAGILGGYPDGKQPEHPSMEGGTPFIRGQPAHQELTTASSREHPSMEGGTPFIRGQPARERS